MKNRLFVRQKDHVDLLIKQIGLLNRTNEIDLSVPAMLTQFTCIRIAGMIEQVLVACLVDYAQKIGHPKLAKFVDVQLQNFSNPKAGKVEALIRSFSDDWERKLKGKSDYERWKTSLDSLMNERHQIAHGSSSTITLGRLRQYYEDSLELLKALDEIIWET